MKLCSVIIPVYNRKDQVCRCLDSVISSSYKNIEIIVIDNASTDDTVKVLKKKYFSDKVKIIALNKNLGAVGGRNEGIKNSKGDYLIFVDSDNVLDKDCIKELVALAEKDPKIGFVGPKMYYYSDKKRIWYAGVKINLLTSQTRYIGINKIDRGQYNRIREVEHIPNVWLVKKEVIDVVGGLDNIYVMTYGESDWPMRAKRVGFRILFCPSAITYHDVPLPGQGLRNKLGFDNKYRIYYVARNRTIFMRRFSRHFFVYLLIFMPVISIVYCINLIKFHRFDLLLPYIRGLFDGINFSLKKRL